MGDRDWLIQPGIDVSHYKYAREEIASVYQDVEIAIHTMTHPDLAKLPTSMAAWEISENKRDLEAIAGHPIRGMSYPFGTYNAAVKETAKLCGIAYSRTVTSTDSFSLPDDFLEWNPTCHYCASNRMELAERFLKEIPAASYQEPLLFYVWGHAYQLDAYQDWTHMEEFLKKLSGQPDIWYASNIEIYDYMKAVQNLIYSSDGNYIFNPSSLNVWMMIDQNMVKIPSGKTVSISWQHKDDK